MGQRQTTLRVSEGIYQLFPEAVLGIVAFRNIGNAGERPELMAALREAEAQTVERFAAVVINDHPQIAPWREAYRKFGAKPKDYPSSVENLVRRVAKGHHLPHINLLVDLYNLVSLRHIVPVGGEDLDRIEGDVDLALATDHEAPVQMLGETEARPPRPGEVIYKDDVGAICRRWNWKEAERTKFTESTRDGFLVVEGLPPVDGKRVEQVLEELAGLVTTYCGGEVRSGLVTVQRSSFELREE
jgi:DNA/RNA-binding domain of Phe-tRNA-synthetase-like protein